jgi:hypothetical protein
LKALILIWRFLSGHHLDGKHRTDAGWIRPATKVLGPTGHASWWAHQVRWRRCGYRLITLGLTIDVIAGWVSHSPVTAVAPFLAVVTGCWLGWRKLGRLKHQRHVERPASAALAPFLGTAAKSVDLAVRQGFADTKGGEHVAALTFPDHYAGTTEQKAKVEEIIRGHLGVDIKPQWGMNLHPKRLNVLRAPTPPGMVALSSVLAELDTRPDHKVLLGRDERTDLTWWDTSLEDPHVAVHGGSRRGKTSLLLAVAAQELARGGEVTVIDPKRIGLMALASVRGFTLISDPRNPQAMWDAVARFAGMVEDRYDQLAADPTTEFGRSLLMLDEVSMLSGMWAAHWRKIKVKGDPTIPPVWGDVATAVWMGAQCHCHVWVAGQRLDYQILGGMLGSFGYRMLAGYTLQDFARLVGQTPVLRSQKHRGRFLVYSGDDPEWNQLVYGQPEDWRDYALDRQRGEASRMAADLAGPTSPVSLREAIAAGILKGSVDAVKRARADDPKFPKWAMQNGQVMLYDPADLREWQASRTRAGRK